MKRKKEKRTQPVRCPYCGAIADLRPASEIYGDESAAGELYVCRNFPSCESYVRACPGTKQPMGPLANGDLRHLRIVAHRSFDQIWKTGVMPVSRLIDGWLISSAFPSAMPTLATSMSIAVNS